MDKNLLRSQIAAFLTEDIGRGDLTSESIFGANEMGSARLVAREEFVVAGIGVAKEVFALQNSDIVCNETVAEATKVAAGDVVLEVSGPVVDLLKAERVALNLLQRMCGIATLTSRFVEAVAGLPVRITDTRKTTPGLRMMEKHAVQVGGGSNHRFNLTDGVLIKDNHIAACGSITEAVKRVREKAPHTIKIEVETDTLDQVEECLVCGADIIMLDNMSPKMMAEAVGKIDGRALVEASGGVNLETVRAIAESGVDIVSVGALTHSAPSCDIGMDWLD
ncbi:carboxylating nicotinate-nucleotide diphosphorylase [Desulfosediminicola ganghwensis]|uniref:carboxylating nicotinate-nucleotide diphosphorylase n=1 Tax=Desulfosediminicola ganghwensis TaxID=2569540 RepID=UPI0010AB77B3|nr:carboxylating nicotinate-nucleotide diphosphorylase [Desulfosediminicola ganghwensis]